MRHSYRAGVSDVVTATQKKRPGWEAGRFFEGDKTSDNLKDYIFIDYLTDDLEKIVVGG